MKALKYRNNIKRICTTNIFILFSIAIFGQSIVNKDSGDIQNIELRDFVTHFQQIRNIPYEINTYIEEKEIINEENENYITIGEPELPDYDRYYYGNSVFYKDFFAIFTIHYESFRSNYEKQELQMHTYNYKGNLIDCEKLVYSEYTRDN